MDILLDEELLVFSREEMLEESVIRCRDGKKFEQKYLRKGENELQIEVVNNWKNRLIGDFSLPKEDRRTWTNQSIWTENSPLQPSGLLGPVEIQSYKYRLK